MKQREVTILGQTYILGCPDGGEALLSAAVASVDREMSAIRDAGKVKARERMAVLAALNLAYQRADAQRSPPLAAASHAAPAGAEGAVAGQAGADAAIERLIRRIDTALGDDGHLL